MLELIHTLYDYNYWANARILAVAENLSEAQFVAPAGMSHGGLRGTLVHALAAEWIWRKRCHERVFPTTMMAAAEFPTLAALRERWQEEETAMRAYVAGLTEAELNQVVKYTTTSGRPMENVLWQILVHLINHGTQTRSEAALLLTGYGCSPGDLDLIVYFRDHA